MTKKLDTSTISNELAGASVFFYPQPDKTKSAASAPTASVPKAPPPQENHGKKTEPKSVRSNVRTNERPTGRPTERKKKRVKIRHSFDIYHDQLIALQTIQLNAVKKGKPKPGLGNMVQQALDSYLKDLQKSG